MPLKKVPPGNLRQSRTNYRCSDQGLAGFACRISTAPDGSGSETDSTSFRNVNVRYPPCHFPFGVDVRVLSRVMIRGLIGLQGKFVISLLIAAALPFVIGLIFFETVGYRLMVAECGEKYRMESAALAAAIGQATSAEAEKLRAWLGSEPELNVFAAQKSQELKPLSSILAEEQIRHIDGIWESLPPTDPVMMAVLRNDASSALTGYQHAHSQVAEMILADSMGRVVAATSKSTDYNQADEPWWQAGIQLPPGEFWKGALIYDESSKVFSVDVVLPLHHEGAIVGLVKMSVDVASLVPHLALRGISTDSSWCFVLKSGHILTSSDDGIEPLVNQIPPEMLGEIKSADDGWLVGLDYEGNSRIVGYTAMNSDNVAPDAYVIFSSLSDELLDPLWGSFIGLAVAGFSLLGLCFLAGFYIIQRKVLRPLAGIEAAVRSLSLLARMRRTAPHEREKILKQHQKVDDNLRLIQQIRTGDQMEVLAQDIAVMISRVLHYQSEVDRVEGNGLKEDDGLAIGAGSENKTE